LSLSAVRRHAAARRPRARARHQPVDPADGRAVRGARRADPRDPPGGIAPAHAASGRAQDHGLHHPLDRRGDPARRPRRRDDRAPRPPQGDDRAAVRPAARRRGRARRPEIRRAARAYLAPAPHRAPGARRQGGLSMTVEVQNSALPGLSDETEDRTRAQQGAAQRRRQKQLQTVAIRIVSLAVVLTLWQFVGAGIDPVLFTTPTKVFSAAVTMIGSGELWTYLWPSLVVLGIGLTLAAVI